MPSRRDLLKSVAATLTTWLLPHRLFATTTDPRFYFLQIDSQRSWPVAEPVAWALANRHQTILERAAEGLAKLTEIDGERVVRRCGLNLLELRPGIVTVHHWSQHQADLRPFFKQHRLAYPEIVVHLRDRKKEVTTTMTGDSYLFGDRIAEDFPLDLFVKKWANRLKNEDDDWQTAPNTNSGFAWDGVENGRIPWAAMKSAWQRAAPVICLNCDTPTILVNFGHRQVGMFNRSSNFVHVCSNCRRSFKDESVKHMAEWMAANLDGEVLPDYEMVWGKRVERMQS